MYVRAWPYVAAASSCLPVCACRRARLTQEVGARGIGPQRRLQVFHRGRRLALGLVDRGHHGCGLRVHGIGLHHRLLDVFHQRTGLLQITLALERLRFQQLDRRFLGCQLDRLVRVDQCLVEVFGHELRQGRIRLGVGVLRLLLGKRDSDDDVPFGLGLQRSAVDREDRCGQQAQDDERGQADHQDGDDQPAVAPLLAGGRPRGSGDVRRRSRSGRGLFFHVSCLLSLDRRRRRPPMHVRRSLQRPSQARPGS